MVVHTVYLSMFTNSPSGARHHQWLLEEPGLMRDYTGDGGRRLNVYKVMQCHLAESTRRSRLENESCHTVTHKHSTHRVSKVSADGFCFLTKS